MLNLNTTCSLLLFATCGGDSAFAQATSAEPTDAFICFEQQRYVRLVRDVEVSVMDANGARQVLSVVGGSHAQLPPEWPDHARLFVVSAAQEALVGFQPDFLVDGKIVAPGLAAFQLDGLEDYIAVLLSPGAPASFTPFSWTLGSPTRRLSIRLPAPAAMGGVKVDIQNPTGGRFHQLVSFTILDGRSGIPLIEQGTGAAAIADEEWPRALDLPVGDYVLLARAEPYRGWHGRVRSGRKYGAARVPFSVREGVSETVVARLTVPALLDVSVQGAVTLEDITRVEQLHERRGMTMGCSATDAAGLVRLRLMREHTYPMPVEFLRHTAVGTSAAGTHLVPWIELGAQATSSALPPGRYTLHASLPGGRSVSREVELKSGEAFEVRVDFGAPD